MTYNDAMNEALSQYSGRIHGPPNDAEMQAYEQEYTSTYRPKQKQTNTPTRQPDGTVGSRRGVHGAFKVMETLVIVRIASRYDGCSRKFSRRRLCQLGHRMD